MNQEDINSLMWDSLPEWRKHQLRMEYDKMCAAPQYNDQTKRIQKLEKVIREFLDKVDHGVIDSAVIVLNFEDKFKQLLENTCDDID